MQKILIVIKLRDHLIIPVDVVEISPTILLGDNFYEVQAAIRRRQQHSFQPDTEGFAVFYNHHFAPVFAGMAGVPPLVCLYYLANKKAYLEHGADLTTNFLNYFAFEYQLRTPDVATELHIVGSIVDNPFVDAWWHEGPMTLCANVDTDAPPVCGPDNDYYTQLDAAHFEHRGAGVTIADAEDFGGMPTHPYLRMPVEVVQAHASTQPEDHFYKTLGVLFATPPDPPAAGQPDINGLVPTASLVVMAFGGPPVTPSAAAGPAPAVDPIRQLVETFLENFRVRAVIPRILKEQTGVLLFERQVSILLNGRYSYAFPLEIFPDMRQAMITCGQQGVVVIQPAGQNPLLAAELGLADTNVDTALGLLGTTAARLRATYTDFTRPIYGNYVGSAAITVSALDMNGFIKKGANYGSLIDIYLWGDCVHTLGKPRSGPGPGFSVYSYTSAASAIAAGIVVALQSGGANLTTQAFKRVFAATFRQDNRDFTAVTLTKLLDQCAAVAAESAA